MKKITFTLLMILLFSYQLPILAVNAEMNQNITVGLPSTKLEKNHDNQSNNNNSQGSKQRKNTRGGNGGESVEIYTGDMFNDAYYKGRDVGYQLRVKWENWKLEKSNLRSSN